jgi:UDP:flavonoid glycosyltransferase YjiC (YdhE family)
VLESRARPRLYLTFGTVFNRSPALVLAAAGLARTGCTIVVTLGADGDHGRLGPVPPHVHVHSYVDQAALLPYCDAVVSHGGAGTMLGAAAHGLPQVLLPQAADHFRNARALSAVGVGTVIEPGELSTEAVHLAASALLESTPHRIAAQHLALEIGAMSEAAEVAAALETI